MDSLLNLQGSLNIMGLFCILSTRLKRLGNKESRSGLAIPHTRLSKPSFVHNVSLSARKKLVEERLASASASQAHALYTSEAVSSLSVAGCSGIVEESQSSIINITVQLLHHIRSFRHAVNATNPSIYDPKATTIRALQSIFHDLEINSGPLSLGDLTAILGWDDCVQHQTAQSSCGMSSIITSLETRLGSDLRDIIKHLFLITKKTYLHSYTPLFSCSNRVERLRSMLVEVNDKKSLHDSLMEFLKLNPIYEHGRLESACTRTLEHLPPVWMIDLRRHQYCSYTQCIVIYKHRHEYPETLDASIYLSNFADFSESWLYRLYGVVVFQKARGQKGQFIIYLRLELEHKAWYIFDGEEMKQVPLVEALDENFGQGRHDSFVRMDHWDEAKGNWRYPRMAETLIYVRETRIHEVFNHGK